MSPWRSWPQPTSERGTRCTVRSFSSRSGKPARSQRRQIAQRTNFSASCRTNCGRRSTRYTDGHGCSARGSSASTEDTARALEAIERNANAQVQLVDDLLDVSRIVTGKMRLDVRGVDLTTVVEAALDAVRPAADAKAIRIQSVLDPRAGPITGTRIVSSRSCGIS